MGDKLFNVNEELIREFLEQKLAKCPDVCGCDICKDDMMTLALNKLPNHYARTEAGVEFQKLKVKDDEINAAIDEAIKVVSAKPRH